MSLLMELGRIVQECQEEYAGLMERQPPVFTCLETVHQRESEEGAGMIALGDNLSFMGWLLRERGMAEKLDLIYIDPPFFSKADYAAEIRVSTGLTKVPQMKQKAYHDVWENGMGQYLRMLTLRLLFMKDLLSQQGSIWIHLDWHAVHYVKLIMDELFGEKNFINEVIWTYKSGGVSSRHFARKHDTLLYYAKGKDYFFRAQKEKSYNRGFRPYRFKGVAEYKDEVGWYTMVNKKDVWQLDMVGRTSAERTGYATQKPEALLEQILESCTKEGDLCADFFCGSGTLAAVAQKLGRSFISCDSGALAIAGCKSRLARKNAGFSCWYPGNHVDAQKIFHGTGIVAAELVGLEEHGDSMLMKLELKGYQLPQLSKMPIGPEQLKAVRKIIKKDPLALVDSWSVDFHYDGKIYRPELFFYREKDKLMVTAEALKKKPVSPQRETVAVKVCDVFGNSGFIGIETDLWEGVLFGK